MAYNKTKHLDAAHKYLQQGKLPQAIAEYQQILKNEPKDQVTLMTLGDLFVRQGETFQGLEYFERLAKIFMNDGFTTKAIAIYKKVAKLAPEESRPLERLAELYVQQGVLSEARPIYLQLAEVQLKAGRQQQAAALLRKLLEAEPDNLRVQTRLAELLLSLGQKKEAIESFQGAAQRLLDHGDHNEAIRMADRILQLDPAHHPTFLLKVRALTGLGKSSDAEKLLETLPDLDTGAETTTMLLELYQENGEWEKSILLVEKIFARDPKNYAVAHRLANMMLEAGDLDRAHSLLAMIRDAMTDAGDHEALAGSINRLAERLPGQIEPLQWLVDLYGKASDSFRLPDALAQLAQAHESAGNENQALAVYEQLLERTPEDETTRRKYMRLRANAGLTPLSGAVPAGVKLSQAESEAKPAPPTAEAALDEETQRYVTQALTDVDLFSSYGLTQKAIDLLESVLERAPRHAPVLERLLDLFVGAGNDHRTVEIASLLQQIALERNDRAAADRFAEFRHRFQRNGPGIVVAETVASPSAATASPQEFAVPVIDAVLDESEMAVVRESSTEASPSEIESMGIPMPVESVVHEVDLSDEWAALSQQLEDSLRNESEAETAQAAVPTQSELVAQIRDRAAAESSGVIEERISESVPSFDLELQPVIHATAAPESMTHAGDALIADLAADLDSATMSLGDRAEAASLMESHPSSLSMPPMAHTGSTNGGSSAVAAENLEPTGPLGDLFEEFRSELGETGNADEDVETHYNLGIAYREMGLLEEAISEFQKVAKSADKGPAFRYAMQCSTLLGLAFMEKGQPAIAAIWYERALKTPGLDQESVLALRYDLGVAQELAGETTAAFNSFSQVYAMNIDYRDVSERISLLGKAR